MTSFLEKLKKGMGVDDLSEEEKPAFIKTAEISQSAEEPMVQKASVGRKTKKKAARKIKTADLEEENPFSDEEEATVVKPTAKASKKVSAKKEDKWPEPEGQLAVDVYQTKHDLVVQSAIAGIRPDLIDVTIENDVITIKGERQKLSEEAGDYFYQECYWGAFSRQIISPVEIDSGRVDASLKDGILTIRVPKVMRKNTGKIVIKS